MVQKQRSISVSLISYLNSKKTAKEKAFADKNDRNDRDINYCNENFGYKIKLNGEKLLVKRTCKPSQMHLLSNRGEEFLAEWLQFSPATIVQIDSRIELDKLNMWANQCRRLGMIVFLRLSHKGRLYKNSHKLNKINSLIINCLRFKPYSGADTDIIFRYFFTVIYYECYLDPPCLNHPDTMNNSIACAWLTACQFAGYIDYDVVLGVGDEVNFDKNIQHSLI